MTTILTSQCEKRCPTTECDVIATLIATHEANQELVLGFPKKKIMSMEPAMLVRIMQGLAYEAMLRVTGWKVWAKLIVLASQLNMSILIGCTMTEELGADTRICFMLLI